MVFFRLKFCLIAANRSRNRNGKFTAINIDERFKTIIIDNSVRR